MSKEYSFSVMPSVSISRSRFVRKSQHKTAFNLGEIVPIYCDEVLPGDTRSIDLAYLTRMSTPIAPIMDNIYLDFFAFFVPNRLVWSHWKEFMGENSASAGIPVSSYSIPKVCPGGIASARRQVHQGQLEDYLGLPLGADVGGVVSALPFRGYYLIYNEWFRNQNVIAPVAIQTGDSNEVLVSNPGFVDASGTGITVLRKAAKLSDYFTKALPYAQKGQPIKIPLGTTAPVLASFGPMSGAITAGSTANLSYTSNVPATGGTTGIDAEQADGVLLADLSNATAATINQLRYAFQLQKLLEKDALYGTRYWEILASHFGVQAPDASLQRPEYLGGHRVRINVDQVLSTTGYDDSSSTDLGKPGANSVSGGKNSLFTKSFVEHGYLFIMAVARHDQTYAQGVNRMWLRSGRYDFYFPVFANLGAQDVKNIEIYAQGTSADDQPFGYQEAWAEYRYKPSISTNIMNPNATGGLSYWTLTNRFGSLPTLGQTFIEQGRDCIKDALATGVTGPDFIADFYFEDIAVRPMPMYSIPGLIDHH